METSTTKWAVSIDGETWNGGFDREAAIAEGKSGAYESDLVSFQIGVAVPQPASKFGPCASDVLAAATEQIRNEVWQDFDDHDASDSAIKALDVMLGHAFAAWVEIYEIGDVGFLVEDEETWVSSDGGSSFQPADG